MLHMLCEKIRPCKNAVLREGREKMLISKHFINFVIVFTKQRMKTTEVEKSVLKEENKFIFFTIYEND